MHEPSGLKLYLLMSQVNFPKTGSLMSHTIVFKSCMDGQGTHLLEEKKDYIKINS